MGKIAAHSAYDMCSWYKYLIVNLVFSHLGFWSRNLFPIAPFPRSLPTCTLLPPQSCQVTTTDNSVSVYLLLTTLWEWWLDRIVNVYVYIL